MRKCVQRWTDISCAYITCKLKMCYMYMRHHDICLGVPESMRACAPPPTHTPSSAGGLPGKFRIFQPFRLGIARLLGACCSLFLLLLQFFRQFFVVRHLWPSASVLPSNFKTMAHHRCLTDKFAYQPYFTLKFQNDGTSPILHNISLSYFKMMARHLWPIASWKDLGVRV